MASAVFASPEVAGLLVEISKKLDMSDHAGCKILKTYLDSLPKTAAPAAPKAAPAPKAAAAPAVGGAGAGAISIDPTEDDPLRNHKHRLQSIDMKLCMGRRIDLKNQIVGTRKDDKGANGIFWVEKQCSKKPEAGGKLCKICKEKDDEYKATGKADKTYYGRLDEPIYYKAFVIGCGYFFKKYPSGIPGDPTSAPPPGYKIVDEATSTKPVAAAVSAPAPAPAPAPVATPVKPTAPASTKAPPRKPSVAKTSVPVIEPEWVVFMYGGRVVTRNTKTNYVYEIDAESVDDKTDIGKIVKKTDYIGVWKNGSVDAYDLSGACASTKDDSDESSGDEDSEDDDEVDDDSDDE